MSVTRREVPNAPPAPGEAPPRRRRLRLSILPTLCTLGNSVCGFLAICYASDANALHAAAATAPQTSAKLVMAGWMIFLGMVFDALDGRLARLTRSTSDFGGALDSLADVVTFGIAPALVAKTLCQDVLGWSQDRLVFVPAAFFACCATLRLARYNAEHEEPDQAVRQFSGLPTPGAASVVAGIAIAHAKLLAWIVPAEDERIVAAQVLALGVLVLLGLLMVSRIPFIHVANRLLAGRRPVGRVALLLLVLALILANEQIELAIAAGSLLFALSGPLGVLPRLFRRRAEESEAELFE